MAGFAQVGCFGAVTNVANAMGQIRGMLMTEGYYMPTTPPLNWMADFVAIPESPKLVDGINRMKGYINIHAQEIAEVKKMKVKALFYDHPASFGLDDERNPIWDSVWPY